MIITSTSTHQKDWQRSSWVQVLAILIGVIPIYILPILAVWQQDEPVTINVAFLYSTVFGGIMVIVILLLLRFLCGERVRDLNLKSGIWWKDILMGIGLTVLTLGTMMLVQGPLSEFFPWEPIAGLADFTQIIQDPLMFILIIGPALMIGAGIFEELTRVFLLSRLWKINTKTLWNWFAIFLSAVLFGLAHLYRGPVGVIQAGISGLILAVFYYYSGRVIPMMLAHYLHDALQFAAIFILANQI